MAERLASKQQFAYLARQVSPDEARRVKALDLPGLLFYKESRRYYPKKELAAHVLGYVGVDNVGLAGLESTFDARIRGREGKMLLQTDARRRAMAIARGTSADRGRWSRADHRRVPAVHRRSRAASRRRRKRRRAAAPRSSFSRTPAKSSRSPTGRPSIRTHSIRADPIARRNRAVQDYYEPGSTFKVVTASAAIEEGLIRTTDPIDCSPGYITFGSRDHPRYARVRRAAVHRRHREVEQCRRDQESA